MGSKTAPNNQDEKRPNAAAGTNRRIDAIFLPQIADMHGVEVEEGGERGCGRMWTIDPAYGRGAYWYLAIDDTAAIAVFDLLFAETVSFGAVVPNFFCFGSYGRNMIPYFTPLLGIEDGWETGTLLGYAWRSGMCREVVPPGERLSVASISLLPEGATETARAIGTDPITLTTAIARLDGTHRIPALSRLFDEIRAARLSQVVSEAYYRCKATEACTLVVDWHAKNAQSVAPRMRAVDRTSLNLACAFAREHLGDPIELDDLCPRSHARARASSRAYFRDAGGARRPMGLGCAIAAWKRACELLNRHRRFNRLPWRARVGFSRQGSFFRKRSRKRFGMDPAPLPRPQPKRVALLQTEQGSGVLRAPLEQKAVNRATKIGSRRATWVQTRWTTAGRKRHETNRT